MIPFSAIRSYIYRFVEPPDFIRIVRDVYVVTFWDVPGGKGLTIEVQTYHGKWVVYVRAQDRVGPYGIDSYVAMLVRARDFVHKLKTVLQRDYHYGPNDDYRVYRGHVYYDNSVYPGVVAAMTKTAAMDLLCLRRKDFNLLWKEVVDDPDAIEAALTKPGTIYVLREKTWVEAKGFAPSARSDDDEEHRNGHQS